MYKLILNYLLSRGQCVILLSNKVGNIMVFLPMTVWFKIYQTKISLTLYNNWFNILILGCRLQILMITANSKANARFNFNFSGVLSATYYFWIIFIFIFLVIFLESTRHGLTSINIGLFWNNITYKNFIFLIFCIMLIVRVPSLLAMSRYKAKLLQLSFLSDFKIQFFCWSFSIAYNFLIN